MDKFDDIWKDRFNEEQLPLDDWNTPDEMVWEAVVPHLAPKKKKRRWWMFWLLSGVVIFILASFIFFFNGNESSIEQSNSTTNSETLISSNNNSNTKNTLTENKKNTILVDTANSNFAPIEEEPLAINVSPFEKNKNSISVQKENKKNIIEEQKNELATTHPTPDLSKTSHEKISKNQENLSNQFKIKSMTPVDGKHKNSAMKAISVIPTIELQLNLSERMHPILPLIDPSPLKENKFSLGINTGATYWKHRISDQYISALSPFDFNYKDAFGWQTTFTANYKINNHFDLFANLQYEQIKTTSGHNSNLTYNLDDETNPINPLNEYVLSLATPYGLSGATFSFNRNENLSSNEVDLLVDFQSTHSIKNISLPLGTVFYPFGKKKKILPSINAGIGINYLIGISNNIKSIETHHDAIQYSDSGSSTFVAPELQKLHFDYRLGLGVQYTINSSSSLQLNYDWSRGINPIFEQEDFQTRVDRHHLSLGLNKRF